MDERLTDESTPSSPPVPSQQSHRHKSLFHCYVHSLTECAVIFFSVHSDPEFDFYIRMACSHLVSGPRTLWSQPRRDSMPAVGHEWPLSPAGRLQETALHMYWIVTKIAQLKDMGEKRTPQNWRAFLFSANNCFSALVRRYYYRVQKTLDQNSGDLVWMLIAAFFYE